MNNTPRYRVVKKGFCYVIHVQCKDGTWERVFYGHDGNFTKRGAIKEIERLVAPRKDNVVYDTGIPNV